MKVFLLGLFLKGVDVYHLSLVLAGFVLTGPAVKKGPWAQCAESWLWLIYITTIMGV